MPWPLGTLFRRMQLPGPRRQTVERLRDEPCCCMLGDVLQRGCHSCGARPAAPGSRRRLAQYRLQYSGYMRITASTHACSSCMQGRRRSLGSTCPRRWLTTHPERSRLLHRKPLTACVLRLLCRRRPASLCRTAAMQPLPAKRSRADCLPHACSACSTHSHSSASHLRQAVPRRPIMPTACLLRCFATAAVPDSLLVPMAAADAIAPGVLSPAAGGVRMRTSLVACLVRWLARTLCHFPPCSDALLHRQARSCRWGKWKEVVLQHSTASRPDGPKSRDIWKLRCADQACMYLNTLRQRFVLVGVDGKAQEVPPACCRAKVKRAAALFVLGFSRANQAEKLEQDVNQKILLVGAAVLDLGGGISQIAAGFPTSFPLFGHGAHRTGKFVRANQVQTCLNTYK